MSIYQLEHDGDVETLREYLARSDRAEVRVRAAEALGEVAQRGEGGVTALVQAVVEDDAAEVRATAVDALDAVGEDALRRLFVALADVDPGESPPATVLESALGSDVAELRMAAATAVGNEGVTAAVPALLDRIRDPDPRVRLRAIRAAGAVGDDRAADRLGALDASQPTKLRRAAATALGEIGGTCALEALLPFLEDPELAVRHDAILALGRFPDRRAVTRLVALLDDPAERIRRAAAYATVELLATAPTDRSHELRSAVVASLADAHEGTVVEALAELFESSTEPHQRWNAAWLLGQVADDETSFVRTLVAALDDDDELVRRFAASSLASIDSPAVETALLEALETTFGEGREMIIFVLGRIGSERARDHLLDLLDRVEEDEVREHIIAALSRLGGTRP